MGAKLLDFYEEARKSGGLKAQMRLAILTGIPSSRAGEVPDSPDNLKKFEMALTTISRNN